MTTYPVRSICRECNRVVYTAEDESEIPIVILDTGDAMHAACFEARQDRLAAKAAKAGQRKVGAR